MNKESIWVPRLLTPDRKLTRLTLSQANLAIFEADQASFLDSFLTQDEYWVHHFDQETKRQLMQWNHPGSPSKDGKGVSSAAKMMASVFWDAKSTVFIISL